MRGFSSSKGITMAHRERERDMVELGKLYGESLSGVSRFQICLKFFKQ